MRFILYLGFLYANRGQKSTRFFDRGFLVNYPKNRIIFLFSDVLMQL